MPGLYKMPMVRMAEKPDENRDCTGLEHERVEMRVHFRVGMCG